MEATKELVFKEMDGLLLPFVYKCLYAHNSRKWRLISLLTLLLISSVFAFGNYVINNFSRIDHQFHSAEKNQMLTRVFEVENLLDRLNYCIKNARSGVRSCLLP